MSNTKSQPKNWQNAKIAPEGWEVKPVTELFDKLPVGKRYDEKTVSPTGRVPVIDQGKSGIIGYHNDEPGIKASPEEPIITFANHTCKVTLQTRDFSVIQNVFPLKAREDVDPWFLYYRIHDAIKFQEYKGHWPEFVTLEFPLPPLAEQKRIAGVLAAFDDKIENNNRIIKTLEEMAQAIFKEWFVHFRFLGHEKAEFVDSPFGRIPKGWEEKELGELVEITKGISYKGSGLADMGVPMINLGCFKRGGEFSYDNLKFYKGEYRPRHIAKVGDLLLSNTDMTQEREIIGNPALVEEWSGHTEYLFTHHIYLLSPKTDISRAYLYYLMKESAFRERVIGAASGTNVLGLTRQSIDDFGIMVPSSDVLKDFGKVADPIRSQGSLAKTENQKLAATRDLLLPKLMSGEIRV